MSNEIISYNEMCRRENASLERGMNYQLRGTYSIILMSRRANSPYRDRIEEDGAVLIYEGHDIPRRRNSPVDPKAVDQPEKSASGTLTQNGHFFRAAQAYRGGYRSPEKVKVYEKIMKGVWSYNGVFNLVDAWIENDGKRNVFMFRLEAIPEDADNIDSEFTYENRRRLIPAHVKLAVWKRDHGQCAICGATTELHFDHIIPYSRGGASMVAENVQILCARHNLAKSDRIE